MPTITVSIERKLKHLTPTTHTMTMESIDERERKWNRIFLHKILILLPLYVILRSNVKHVVLGYKASVPPVFGPLLALSLASHL